MWPSNAELALLKKCQKPWVRDAVMNILDIEFYFGRVPIWYIEERLLRRPGDFALTRDHEGNLRVSVMTNEKDNPVATLSIAYEVTNQVKGDRNCYYRINGTSVQSNSIWGLITHYMERPVSIL